jgi:hypothetical protein
MYSPNMQHERRIVNAILNSTAGVSILVVPVCQVVLLEEMAPPGPCVSVTLLLPEKYGVGVMQRSGFAMEK